MGYTDIIYEKKGAAAWITINKPHVMNALGEQTLREILDALADARKDPAIMVLVFKGANHTFCAGMDLKEHSKRLAAATEDPTIMTEFQVFADGLFNGVESFPKVTIAMVEGVCMAGGFEIAEVCDFIIADENARIGDGHIRTGLVPNGGASIRLPRLINISKAKELLYTGILISGSEAEKCGLVYKAVSSDKLEETVNELIGRLADKPPLSLQAMKMLVNKGQGCTVDSGLRLERYTVNYLETTEDLKEAVAAFGEKRKPVYKGR